MMSMSNIAFHEPSSLPWTRALAFETSTSMPPSASPAATTNALIAGPSEMSTAWPNALTPLASSFLTASATCSALRAQMATLAPSSAKHSAMDQPMPRVAPVITAVLPLSCRSIAYSLV